MFSSPLLKRLTVVVSTAAATALFVAGLSVAPAAADTAPPPSTLPQTVSADVLPTPQINGVVWNVAVVGTTAYAVGSFTSARPYGSPAGRNEVARNNAMAFNVTTGAILPWNPNLSAQARSVKTSPDKTKLYVGGDFNTVGGTAQSKIVAFDLPSGNRDPNFKPAASGSVVGIAVSNTTVYAGGSFQSAGNQPRQSLAAFNRTNGALLPWAPTADDIVEALAVTPDSSRVIVGGRFQNLNGAGIVGIGAVDGTTGATQTWTSRPIPTRQGDNRSWTTDLLIKDGVVYGAADGEGGHWFDGRFAANLSNGDLIWLDNCYGATYGVQVIGQVAYYVDHSHDCTSMNTFPQQTPQVWKRAIADTIYATGTDQAPPGSNMNYSHQPIPTQLNWYPVVNTGSYTGAFQGGWSLGTDGNYLVMGGEFTNVNGSAQQGLATFATRNVAPNKVGPQYTSGLKPTALSLSSGTARIAFTGTADYDDAVLTYQVLRDNSMTPIYSVDLNSEWWSLPQSGFIDTGLAPGSTHTYRIQVKDPWGNSTIGPRSDPVTISSAAPSAYTTMVANDGASTYWPLNETGGSIVYDNVGFNDADAGTGVTRGASGAVPGTDASNFDGTANGTVSTRSAIVGPNVFTIEAWFKTSSTTGGKIIGFGDQQTGNSSSYDRHVYLDGSGRVTFGVYPGGVAAITSKPGFNDGQWHLVTASLGSDGMNLYLDGVRSASRSDVTTAQAYSGYWRVGGDNLNGWPNTGSNVDFVGSIGSVAIYPAVLPRATVLNHYTSTGRTSSVPTAPSDAYGKLVYEDSPDLYWRLDSNSTSLAKDSGITGNDGLISGGVTPGQSGALAGGVGNSYGFNGTDALIASSNAVTNPTTYTEEIWFNTTTTVGGKLIGFGNQQTGTSGNYDRHIYMQDDGTLAFGVWTGQTNLAISPNAYNDGNWHQAVATQSSDGLKLYVDGALVATNPQTSAQSYTGYWRIGGDTTWSSSSAFFNGRLDEAAVYPTALSASRILEHYQAGTGVVTNVPPTAAFTASTSGLSVSVDGTSSTDSDGTVSGYAWDFGDGSTGTGATATHTYSAAGTYTVGLVVTDDKGANSTATTQQVTVSATNVPPTAAFTASTSGLSVSVDGTSSTDSDGTVSGYAWDFGDGSTGTGATATHTYSAAGTYTVGLVVTDDKGANSTATTQQVTVNATTQTVLAQDGFGRTVAAGFGNADLGGAWTSSSSSSNFSVSGGVGRMLMRTAGSGPAIYLNSVNSNDTEVTIDVGLDKPPTGGGITTSVIGRSVDGQGDYRAKVMFLANGTVTLGLAKTNSTGAQTSITADTAIPGLTYAVGDTLTIKLQVYGTSPTTINARIWKVGTPEPATWQASTTDTTAALQAAGRFGLFTYQSGSSTNAPVTALWDNLLAVKTGN